MEEQNVGNANESETPKRRNCDKLREQADILFLLGIVATVVYFVIMVVISEEAMKVLSIFISGFMAFSIWVIKTLLNCFCDLVENSYKK